MKSLKVGTFGAWAVLCFAVVSWGLAKDTPQKGSPPKPVVQQPDGHWSPYQPAEDSAATTSHRIDKGDTLWGLAGKHLGDPHLWPQLWEANPYIRNPHWIYPGDTIAIKKPVVLTEERLKEEIKSQATSQTSESEEQPSSSQALNQPVVTLQPRIFEVRRPSSVALSGRDLYCSGYITQQPLPMGTFIVGAEDERYKARFIESDVIYINKGRRQEIVPGAEYAIVRPKGTVKGGPKNKQKLGNYVAEIGKARILVVHANSSTAEVIFACDTVLVGDMLIPFSDRRPALSKVSMEYDDAYALQRLSMAGNIESPQSRGHGGRGQIVLAKFDLRILIEGHIVYVDIGKQAGLSSGDVLAVYRDPTGFGPGGLREEIDIHPSYERESLGFREAVKKAIKDRLIPPRIVGELVVLHTNDTTATAKVVYAREELQLGDKVVVLH